MINLSKINIISNENHPILAKTWLIVMIMIGLLFSLLVFGLFASNTMSSLMTSQSVEEEIDLIPQEIPGKPFRGKNAPERSYKHLENFHGIPRSVSSNRLHKLK